MRVIAGTARGTRLHSVEGESTRPILDRVKESLFSILQAQDRLEGARVLDLFAGSGAIGIEALSRGATTVVFVESSKSCTAVIEQNLRSTGLEGKVTVFAGDVSYVLAARLNPEERYDLIFFDPPFADLADGLDSEVSEVTLAAERLAPDGLLLVRHERIHAQPERFGDLHQVDYREWGRNAVTMYAGSGEMKVESGK